MRREAAKAELVTGDEDVGSRPVRADRAARRVKLSQPQRRGVVA
jgi:hypothetical protein